MPAALPLLLGITTRLKRLHITDPDAASWDGDAMAAAVMGLGKLEELRLHCSDMLGYDKPPFSALLLALGGSPAAGAAPGGTSGGEGGGAAHPPPPAGSGGGGAPSTTAPVAPAPTSPRGAPLPQLRKLALFMRVDALSAAALARFLHEPDAPARSKKLVKLKLSTSLLSSPGGTDVLMALAAHPALRKLTVLRPEGMGEPVRKAQCAAIALVMQHCATLRSVHIRRAGMWTDTLAALAPAVEAPNIECLKLDSNSLAYLSSTFFNDAMGAVLSKLPSLRALHLGNNQLDAAQAVGLAASLLKRGVGGPGGTLKSLTLGSNDVGDAGLAAVLKVLPVAMEQLYLHGTQITDAGVPALRDALGNMPKLWGLGLCVGAPHTLPPPRAPAFTAPPPPPLPKHTQLAATATPSATRA